jgi:hypothetical protein
VDVEISPSLALAHELGHYLRNLIVYKSNMDLKAKIVSKGILGPTSPGVNIHWDKAMKFATEGKKDRDRMEYMEILEKVVPHPKTFAELAFVGLWNHGIFSEMVNILPIAKILGSSVSNYSDSVIMGEAYVGGGYLAFTRNNGALPNVSPPGSGVVLNEESFIRFGHYNSEGFWRILRRLIFDVVGSRDIGIAIIAANGGNIQNVRSITNMVAGPAIAAVRQASAGAVVPVVPAPVAPAVAPVVTAIKRAAASDAVVAAANGALANGISEVIVAIARAGASPAVIAAAVRVAGGIPAVIVHAARRAGVVGGFAADVAAIVMGKNNPAAINAANIANNVAGAGGNAAANNAIANIALYLANDTLNEFKDLVQKLLDTITMANGQTLWANNNNLPTF